MTPRYHGLDLARAIAMLFGLPIHAALVIRDGEMRQLVLPGTRPDLIAAPWIDVFELWIHLWRMPLFFLLAGFFAAMTLERRGARAFLTDRAWRLGAVLVVFVLLFNVAFQRPWGSLDHLWFLYVLVIVCVPVAAWHGAGLPIPRARAWWLLPAPLIVAALAHVAKRGAFGHHRPLVPWEVDPLTFVWYAPFVVAGLTLWRGRDLLDALARPLVWVPLLLIAHVAYAVALGSPSGGALRALGSGMATLGLVLGFVGLALRVLRRASAWVDRATAVAYPVYVLHLYPTMMATALVLAAGAGQGVALWGGALAGLGAALALWAVLRRTPVARVFAPLSRRPGPAPAPAAAGSGAAPPG